MTNPTTAVIILNWNGRQLLSEFLPKVIENTPSQLATVIVADNGSTDGSLQLLAQEFPQVQILPLSKNHGFAQGYNLALEHYARSYPLCVLLNSDAAPAPGWLAPLQDYMHNHPECGACQPKILSYTNPSHFEYAGACGGYLDRLGYPYCRGRIMDTIEPDTGQYDTIRADLHWATGAALMVRSDVYLKAGGLDAQFFAHMEEIDLCWRIRLLGYHIAAVPQSTVYHLGGGSLSTLSPHKTYLNFRNNLLMLHKNLPPHKSRHTLLIRRMVDTLAWAKYLITGKWTFAAAVVRAHRHFASMRRCYITHPRTDLLHTSPPSPNILTEYFLLRHKKFSEIHG